MPSGHFPSRDNSRQHQHHCRQGDRHPSPASLGASPRSQIPTIAEPATTARDQEAFTTFPNRTAPLKKRLWHLFLAGRRPRIHAPAGPVCLPFRSRTSPPPLNGEAANTRDDDDSVVSMEMHSHRQHRRSVPARCPRRKSCPSEPNGVGSFGIGAGVDKLAPPPSPPPSSSVDLWDGGWGRR